MNELEKINIEYTAKRLALIQYEKFIELQKAFAIANNNALEYVKSKIIEEIKK